MTYFRSKMPKSPSKQRFEVHFDKEDANRFYKLAAEQNRSVKNLMETILLEKLGLEKKKKKEK